MLESVRNVVDMVVSTVTTSHTLAMLLMTCIAIYWFTHNNNNKMKLSPGPPGYPIIGNILDFKGSSIIKKSLELKDSYGPVIAFSTGPIRWIVLTSMETVAEAFVQRAADFSNRPRINSIDYITGGGQDIAMSQHTPNQQFRRKVAMQAMRQYMTGDQYTKRVHSVVTQCIDEMLAVKGPLDPHVYIGNANFNIIHSICYGYTRRADDPTYVELLRVTLAAVTDLINYWEDVVPFLTYWPTKRYRQFQKDADFYVDYIKGHVQKRRAVLDENRTETLVDILLTQKRRGEDDSNRELTDTAVTYMIFDLFTGGFESTATTMEWVILMIATHQDVQQKIHEEIDSALGDGMLSRGQLSQFVYTEAVILEVMRLYPAIYTSGPHQTSKDTQVAGYDIPANTIVLTNLMAIHRDPQHWEKPDSFMPERFLENDGKTLKPRPKSWMPFSVGPRNCIGEFLAKANLVYSLVVLLQKLHFNMAPENETPDFQPEDYWTRCVCKPYKVIVTKHRG